MPRKPIPKKERRQADARAKVTQKTYNDVRRLAKRQGLTVSDIVRIAVCEKLEREEAAS